MIKTDLVRVSQENYNRKKAEINAMEYSKHIARKNTRKTIIFIVWLIFIALVGVGLVSSIELAKIVISL